MKIVRYISGEWSALYVDGKLVVHGDHYLTDDKLEEMLQVERRDDDVEGADFLRGTNRDAAPTLEDVEAYTAQRKEKEAQAAELRRQADDLMRQAEELRAKANNA